MRTLIFLSMIRRDEYDPKKHRLVDLPNTNIEELLHYYRGTAVAVLQIERGIITTHDLARVQPALERAHAEVVRRMMGRPTAGAPDGYMADLLFAQEDLRIPDLSAPLHTEASRPSAPSRQPQPQSTQEVGGTPTPPAMTPHAGLAGLTNEALMHMEATQVAKLKEIWGSNLSLEPKAAEQEKQVDQTLTLIREEMKARLLEPTHAFQEERMFRQRIMKARQAQNNRSRGKDRGM